MGFWPRLDQMITHSRRRAQCQPRPDGNCGRHFEGETDFAKDPTCPECVQLHVVHAATHPGKPDPNWRYDAYPDIDG
jgi:hypothetical protein